METAHLDSSQTSGESNVVQNQLEEEMASETQDFDAVVIGAGFSGMYMLKSLRDKLGLNVRVYEAGDTVGGTWYAARRLRVTTAESESANVRLGSARCHNLSVKVLP